MVKRMLNFILNPRNKYSRLASQEWESRAAEETSSEDVEEPMDRGKESHHLPLTSKGWNAILNDKCWLRIKSNPVLLCLLATALLFGAIGGGVNHLSTQNCLTSSTPFNGAFSSIPTRSQLPNKYRRLSLVAVWNKNYTAPYLRHFFYTAQLNADVLDVLFVNRKIEEGDQCLDLATAGIDTTWGGNIKVVCMGLEEWKKRHVDVLCSKDTGWNCTSQQRGEVYAEFRDRKDERNFFWRPLKGNVFRDLFIHPQNPLWGWVDVDTSLGRFTRFPNNIMSKMSILSVNEQTPEEVFLAGQLAVFNFEDKNVSRAWMKIKTLESADAFTKYTNGKHSQETEETLWSYAYLNLNGSSAGVDLNYTFIPYAIGDDPQVQGKDQKRFAISGRDIVLVEHGLSRKEIEQVIMTERSLPPEEAGDIGWTTGEDGSEQMLEDSSLSSKVAIELSCRLKKEEGKCDIHAGYLETVKLQLGKVCESSGHWIPEKWRICVPTPTVTEHRGMQSSLVHLTGQEPGLLFRKYEPIKKHVGYERRLLRHYHWSKNFWDWFSFPSFDITEDFVFVMGAHEAYVFKMGSEREKNITRVAEKSKP